MRRIQEIEIELPQIVLERADAAYAQIRQQASQEKQLTGKRFPRAAGRKPCGDWMKNIV